MRKLVLLFCLLFPVLLFADDSEYTFRQVVEHKRGAFSNNIVFVLDTSSSVRQSVMNQFNKAWETVISQIGTDEVYFSIYAFNDEDSETFRKWEPATRDGLDEATKWISENGGLYSYGKKAIEKALKQTNPLNPNKSMRKTLTMILITDGGFTEAAKEENFKSFYETIGLCQAWRVEAKLSRATICTVGIENKDPRWDLEVKRPDGECQAFLKLIGKTYDGGYFLSRKRKPGE